jgi:hypothetical protein
MYEKRLKKTHSLKVNSKEELFRIDEIDYEKQMEELKYSPTHNIEMDPEHMDILNSLVENSLFMENAEDAFESASNLSRSHH